MNQRRCLHIYFNTLYFLMFANEEVIFDEIEKEDMSVAGNASIINTEM